MTTALARLGSADLAINPDSPEFREHVETTASYLARSFQESVASIRRHWLSIQAETQSLHDLMASEINGDLTYLRPFRLDLYYAGRQKCDYPDEPAIDAVIKQMNTKVWSMLIDRMGVKNLMSIKRREEYDKQVEAGDVPEVTEANILAVILGLADRAAEFATDAAKETLDLLTPGHSHYKTNSGFKVGRRAILEWYVEQRINGRGFWVRHERQKQVIAIDGTFHVLDGKGPIKGRQSPLVEAIRTADGCRGETPYFAFRACKNCNLHLTFLRLDLVKQLNGLATGEYVLGQDVD